MPGDKRRKRRMDELRKDMIKHEGILEQRLEADDIPEAKRLRGSIIELEKRMEELEQDDR